MKFTNTGNGPRGLNMKNGSTIFLEMGETVDLNKSDVAKVHPDIEEGAKAAKEAKPDDAE